MSSGLSLLPELISTALPVAPLDRGVARATTGVLLFDALPLVTMIPACHMLRWYASRRRWWDLATFSLGWFLAVMYHIAHMNPEGLASAHVLGLGGAAWRTLDIVSAQSLLARTIGHALGGRSAAVGLLSNAAFPCLVALHAQVYGAISLATTARLLLLVAGAILGAKLLVEGAHTLPTFDTPGARKAGLLFLAAFVVFPLPEVWPLLYWLFHSVWHVCLASAYGHLYRHLESSARAKHT